MKLNNDSTTDEIMMECEAMLGLPPGGLKKWTDKLKGDFIFKASQFKGLDSTTMSNLLGIPLGVSMVIDQIMLNINSDANSESLTTDTEFIAKSEDQEKASKLIRSDSKGSKAMKLREKKAALKARLDAAKAREIEAEEELLKTEDLSTVDEHTTMDEQTTMDGDTSDFEDDDSDVDSDNDTSSSKTEASRPKSMKSSDTTPRTLRKRSLSQERPPEEAFADISALSLAKRQRLKQSWLYAAQNGFDEIFYERLFQANSNFKNMFNNKNETQQGEVLTRVLGYIVKEVCEDKISDTLFKRMEEMAERHAFYGVNEKDVSIFCGTILSTVKEVIK